MFGHGNFSATVKRRNKRNCVVVLNRVVISAFQLPIRVIDQHDNAWAHRAVLDKHLLFVAHVPNSELLNKIGHSVVRAGWRAQADLKLSLVMKVHL